MIHKLRKTDINWNETKIRTKRAYHDWIRIVQPINRPLFFSFLFLLAVFKVDIIVQGSFSYALDLILSGCLLAAGIFALGRMYYNAYLVSKRRYEKSAYTTVITKGKITSSMKSAVVHVSEEKFEQFIRYLVDQDAFSLSILQESVMHFDGTFHISILTAAPNILTFFKVSGIVDIVDRTN